MKHIFSSIFAAMTLSFIAGAQAPVADSVRAKWLDREEISLVLRIFDGRAAEDITSQIDVLISSGKSPEEQAWLARNIYQYYLDSKVMGYDRLSVYVADNYFLNGKLKLESAEEMTGMKLFANHNRQSLVGNKAPEISFEDASGNIFPVLKSDYDFTVLYFWDNECAICRQTTPRLLDYLEKIDRDVNVEVFMVFTKDGSKREQWLDYYDDNIVRRKMPENVTLHYVWDPDYKTDFSMKYGVLSTPGLFLINSKGIIVGRRLNANSLRQVVDVYKNAPSELDEVFDNAFSLVTRGTHEECMPLIHARIDAFFNQYKDKPEFFCEIFYSMYQYLKSHPNYDLQCGAAYLAQKYILDIPALWENVKFTHRGSSSGMNIRAPFSSVSEFMEKTAEAVDLFWRNPLGEKPVDLSLRDAKNKKLSISSLFGKTASVIYFHTLDCAVCEATTVEIERMSGKYQGMGVGFVAVYVGKDKAWKDFVKKHSGNVNWLWDPKGESGMFNTYDLADVPSLYLISEDGITVGKDLNPSYLESLLDYLTQYDEKEKGGEE